MRMENMANQKMNNENSVGKGELKPPKKKSDYVQNWIETTNFAAGDSLKNDNTHMNSSPSTEKVQNYMENSINIEGILDGANKYTNQIKSLGDINIKNASHVHVGNITYITGPVHIVQTHGDNIDELTSLGSSSKNSAIHPHPGNIKHQVNIRTRNFFNSKTKTEKPASNTMTQTTQPVAVPYVIICNTEIPFKTLTDKVKDQINNIREVHSTSQDINDTTYNFLVGCDGIIYEGRGWGKSGDHTDNYNKNSLGIAFVGKYCNELPPEKCIIACKRLIKRGIRLGYIKADHKLIGQCSLGPTKSPGPRIFEEIKSWSNYVEKP